MMLKQLLFNLQDRQWWRKKPVIIFNGQEYPFNFFNKLLKKLKSAHSIPLNIKAIQLSDTKNILPLLQQSVLGNHFFYWLGNLDEGLSSKQKASLFSLLERYQGPHQISYFTLNCSDSLETIFVPTLIELNDFLALAEYFLPSVLQNAQKMNLIHQLFASVKKISLDGSCKILDYLELSSAKHVKEVYPYLEKIFPHNNSLTMLAEYFFAKKKSLFWLSWSTLSPEYPTIFWLAYWSEQIWRAYHVKLFIEQKNIALAKKMSFKLPYSFFKKDHTLYSLEYLKGLYSYLYLTDYKLKQGFEFCFFDFMFFKHFSSPILS